MITNFFVSLAVKWKLKYNELNSTLIKLRLKSKNLNSQSKITCLISRLKLRKYLFRRKLL